MTRMMMKLMMMMMIPVQMMTIMKAYTLVCPTPSIVDELMNVSKRFISIVAIAMTVLMICNLKSCSHGLQAGLYNTSKLRISISPRGRLRQL